MLTPRISIAAVIARLEIQQVDYASTRYQLDNDLTRFLLLLLTMIDVYVHTFTLYLTADSILWKALIIEGLLSKS